MLLIKEKAETVFSVDVSGECKASGDHDHFTIVKFLWVLLDDKRLYFKGAIQVDEGGKKV